MWGGVQFHPVPCLYQPLYAFVGGVELSFQFFDLFLLLLGNIIAPSCGCFIVCAHGLAPFALLFLLHTEVSFLNL